MGRLVLASSVLLQLVVLYWPRTVSLRGGFPWDKVAHVVVFGAVVLAGRWAGLRERPLWVVLAVHAALSEVLQAWALPGRSGDVWDVAADLAGTGLAILLLHRMPEPRRGDGTPCPDMPRERGGTPEGMMGR